MRQLQAFWLSSFLIYSFVNCIASAPCPDSDIIKPCTCSAQGFKSQLIVTYCRGLTTADDLREIFGRVPGWKMHELNIVDSSMLYIPSAILNGTSIRQVDIQGSTFVSLFDAPPASTNLEYVMIRNCQFQMGIQWNLFALTRITSLKVENTPIKRLGKDFRDGMPKTLEDMTLTNTNLMKISNDALVKLENLKYIYITYGTLKSIDNIIFPKNVQNLDFSYQKIETLANGIFNFPPTMHREISLKFNKITTIKKEVFLSINDFALVILDGNPINCNCDIKWIFTSGIDRSVIKAKCRTPESLRYRTLQQLTLSDFDYCK